MPHQQILHGTAIALAVKDGLPLQGILLRGPSGSGKSDLALRMIENGATLVSDDQVALEPRRGLLHASSIDPIRNLLEVRGVGLLRLPCVEDCILSLVVNLVPRDKVPRMPDFEKTEILGIPVAVLDLHAFDASTPGKIKIALETLENPDMLVGHET